MVHMVDEMAKLQAQEVGNPGEKRGDGDVPRLQYIRISYDFILGKYCASLFPERIGRIVLIALVIATTGRLVW